MQGRLKWQRVLTITSLIVSVLFLLLCLAMVAGASAAAGIELFPLLVLLVIGLPISGVGLWLTIKLGPQGWRRRGFVINGAASALYVVVTVATVFALMTAK